MVQFICNYVRGAGGSCAVGELNSIGASGSPEAVLIQLFQNGKTVPAYDSSVWFTPIIVFSGASVSPVTAPDYSENFMKYIVNNKLGTVYKAEKPVMNHHGGYVTGYMWIADKDALVAWWATRKPDIPKIHYKTGLYNLKP